MARADKKADAEYKNAYQKENYYRPSILLPKEYKKLIEDKIGSQSKSSYIKSLIDKDLEGK